jgi:hypothetical protein
MRVYRYVGPKRIAGRAGLGTAGFPIRSPDDLRTWIQVSAQAISNGIVIATFVVDADGVLLVADRRSEHVACAGGGCVQSAGEITFEVGQTVKVVNVTNQSTGYCPEPESWPAVAQALSRAGLDFADGFSLACQFRRCIACDCITLVKVGVFKCEMCGATLPASYNVQG